jgi:ribosomal protein S18 acetylase RimI-like enzyme
MPSVKIRKIAPDDKPWISEFLSEHWSSPLIVTRGRAHRGDMLPGFIAIADDIKVGLITYNIENGECEIISLNATLENKGIGTALIDAVKATAGCRRIWLITTNDNLHAIEFYKRRGFILKAIYHDAINESRKIKPSIPEYGNNGIPIKDELEFEILLY